METLHFDPFATSTAPAGPALAIEPGAHLVSERDGYTHHGIYVGDGRVIHYGGFLRSAKRRPVEYIALRRFAAGRGIRVQPDAGAVFSGAEIVARAKSRLGEDRYQFLSNNCEHFCTWCVRGVARSEQVRQCLRHPLAGLRTLFALVRARMESSRLQASITRRAKRSR